MTGLSPGPIMFTGSHNYRPTDPYSSFYYIFPVVVDLKGFHLTYSIPHILDITIPHINLIKRYWPAVKTFSNCNGSRALKCMHIKLKERMRFQSGGIPVLPTSDLMYTFQIMWLNNDLWLNSCLLFFKDLKHVYQEILFQPSKAGVWTHLLGT